MRNMLAFLAAAVLVFVGVGWYLDWFKLRTAPAGDGHQSINIDLNTKKIAADTQKGVHGVVEEGKQFLEKDKGADPKSGIEAKKDGDPKPAPKEKKIDISLPIPDIKIAP